MDLVSWIYEINFVDFRCSGKSATGKSEMVAVLSGHTFADALMVALLPIDTGKSATLIISI